MKLSEGRSSRGGESMKDLKRKMGTLVLEGILSIQQSRAVQ